MSGARRYDCSRELVLPAGVEGECRGYQSQTSDGDRDDRARLRRRQQGAVGAHRAQIEPLLIMSARLSQQDGFSLAELMVSMAIMLLIAGGATTALLKMTGAQAT